MSAPLDLLRRGWALLFPSACAACLDALEPWDEALLCAGCMAELRPLPASECCPCCGALNPVPSLRAVNRCTACEALPAPGFVAARGAFHYSGSAGRLLRRLKFQRVEWLAEPLAGLAAGPLRPFVEERATPDLVVSVPGSLTRRLWRRFDQGEAIARALARQLSLRYCPGVLHRTRRLQPQARHRGLAARLANVRGAFAVKDAGAVAGRRVLLVDDVLTSGATAAACAEALVAAGAQAVYVATVLRASGSMAP